MNVYLLNPPYKENFVRCGRWQGVRARGKTLYYPIWLAYATGILEEYGCNVRLVDAIANGWDKNKTLDDVKAFSPDVLVVDTNFSSLKSDISYASYVKKTAGDHVMTIVMGPPTSVYAFEILDDSEVDVVVRKEMDYTLVDIVERIENRQKIDDIPGISCRTNGSIRHNPDRPFLNSESLDRLPYVSKVYNKHLDVNAYWLDHTINPMVQIITSRGCPNACTFCSWPENLFGRKYRARSATNVVNEIEYILNNMPQVKEIFFEDDTFTADKKRVLEFTKEVQDRRLKFTWSCQSRATLDYEILREMKKAGCRLLDVGFESGSDIILENIKKGVTTARTRQFALDVKKSGMLLLADFVFGFPGETKETAAETVRFIHEIKPNLVQIAIATPIPGTHFHDWVSSHGFLQESDMGNSISEEGFQKCIISYPQMTNRDLEALVGKALKNYYLNPSYIPTAMSNIMRRNGLHELKGLLSSAITFRKYLSKSS